MKYKEIKITPNGIKQALDNLLNENEKLQKEIKILKENAEHNDKVVDKVNRENMLLKGKNQKYKEVIDKAIEYIEKCLKQTPTENRTKTDDTLDIEYEYILGILKEVK